MTIIPARPYSHPPATAPRTTPRLLVAFRFLLYGGLLLAAVCGGPVVRVGAICAIPLALLIDWEGGVRHILRMGGLALAIWLAPQYGGRLGDLVSVHWGVSPTVSNIVGIGLIAVLIIATGGILARLASRQIRRRRLSEAFDHMLGGLLGTAEAGLAVVCGCWMLASLAGPIASVQAHISQGADNAVAFAPGGVSRAGDGTLVPTPPTRVQPGSPRTVVRKEQQSAATPQEQSAQQQTIANGQQIQQRILKTLSDLGAAVQDDQAGQWLLQNNPLENLTPVRTAGVLLEVAADPGVLLSAVDKGELDEIAALPAVRKYTDALQRDPALREALRRQDFAAVLSHPLIKSMLTDSELRRALLDNVDQLQHALAIDDLTAEGR
jgi:uncharacterized membrane protein required for colicin V production